MKTLHIQQRPIGIAHPCFIIAEAGVNHNGDLHQAHALIDAAKEAGADAVKFQAFRAESLVTESAPLAAYQKTTGELDQADMLRRLELTAQDFRELHRYCQQRDILFLCTPFDLESVEMLHELNVPAYKVSSGDVTHFPMLSHIANAQKPMILSTGMSTLPEVKAAKNVIYATGNRQLILLHCVSIYPADPARVNLRAMQTLAASCGVPVGFSDHTLGTVVAVTAVAMGARVLEKHLTLDQDLPGPDHRASIEPHTFAQLVIDIRTAEASMGTGIKEPVPEEHEVASVVRRSLVAYDTILGGTILTARMLDAKRPGSGLCPSKAHLVIGRTAIATIPAGTILHEEMFA